ncbi:MAG: DciA family protein [Steroidobacterales bacterium]
MQNPRVVSELLQQHGKKLRELSQRLAERAAVLEVVRGSLPAKLATHIASAGLENGRLTIGVGGAAWASRLRYLTGAVRTEVGAALGLEIVSVRIRVLPPTPP